MSRTHTPRLPRLSSMRARMTLGFALFIALLMLLGRGALVWTARHEAEARAQAVLAAAQALLKSDSSGIERGLRAAPSTTPPEPPPPSFNPFRRPPPPPQVLEDGELSPDLPELARRANEKAGASDLALLIVDSRGKPLLQSQNHVPRWPIPRRDANDWRLQAQPLSNGRTLLIALPWRKTEDDLRRQSAALLALSLLVTGGAALGAWLLVGRTLAPIGALARQAEAQAHEPSSPGAAAAMRLEPPSHDAEVVELVGTLNGMLARLSESAVARGQFYAAASHELRTPLQALSGHLEIALRPGRPAEYYHEALEEAHVQARRLISLTQDLLLLNQLDTASATGRAPEPESVDLASACERALSRCRPLVHARSLRLEEDLGDALLEAPPLHVEMLARNLIENALKYAREGGLVRVSTSTGRASTCRLEVFNECALEDGWQSHKWFEPFFRPDASRNSETGGNGLGLAICHSVALSNGWRLALHEQQAAPQGILVTVDFSPDGVLAEQ